ncbi:MAG: hypothetical protein JWO06_2645 [Bacteroidota bacterium]|nr:hypothetical protein [Bacteroidota bacterium]
MPGRLYSPDKYNYGFNGKLKDDETYNNAGTEYDYGFRIYNSRLGRFLSVDPLTQKYAYLTPYQFASNTPIRAVDVDGAEGAVKKYDFDFPTGGGGGEILLEELEDGASLRIKSPAQNSVQEGGGGGPARYAPPPTSAPKITPAYEIQEHIPVTPKPTLAVQTGPPPVTGNGPSAAAIKNLSKQQEIDVANLQGKRARGDALTASELSRLRALEAQQATRATASLSFLKKADQVKDIPYGCEKVARQVQKAIGGEFLQVTPKEGLNYIGDVRGQATSWAYHVAVVKDGKVFDKLTGAAGMAVEEYKKMFDNAKDLKFETVKDMTVK